MVALLDLSLGLYQKDFFGMKITCLKDLDNYIKPLNWSVLKILPNFLKYQVTRNFISSISELTKENISKIIILNMDGSLLTPKICLGVKLGEEIVNQIKIFNYNDFGWTKENIKNKEDLWGENFLLSWGNKVLEEIGEQKVLLIGEFITPLTLKLITQIIDDSIIYRRTFFNQVRDNELYLICDDNQEYLNYLNKYYKKAIQFEKTSFRFDQNPFLKINCNLTKETTKYQIIGKDEYLTRKFVRNLQQENNLYLYDCSDGKYEIKWAKLGLIFYGVNKLTVEKRNELVAKAMNSKYKKRVIAFVTSEPFDMPHLPHIQKIFLPSFNEIREYSPQFFYSIIFEKYTFTDLEFLYFNKIYAHLMSGGVFDNIFNSIQSFSEIDQYLEEILLNKKIKKNLLHPDFWYEFVQDYESEKFSNEIDKDNIKPIELTFIYDVNTNKDNWIVTSNLLDAPVAIEYDKSLGIKIMAYLKEYPSCKKLDAIELRKKIKDYYGKEYKPQKKKTERQSDPYKNAYNAMRGAVKYDLIKIFKDLKDRKQIINRILKRFKFSNYCYYTEKEDVNVVLEFHDPDLKNYPPI